MSRIRGFRPREVRTENACPGRIDTCFYRKDFEELQTTSDRRKDTTWQDEAAEFRAAEFPEV